MGPIKGERHRAPRAWKVAVRAWLVEHGKTQTWLAAEIGRSYRKINVSTLSVLLHDKGGPGVDQQTSALVPAISAITGIHPAELAATPEDAELLEAAREIREADPEQHRALLAMARAMRPKK